MNKLFFLALFALLVMPLASASFTQVLDEYSERVCERISSAKAQCIHVQSANQRFEQEVVEENYYNSSTQQWFNRSVTRWVGYEESTRFYRAGGFNLKIEDGKENVTIIPFYRVNGEPLSFNYLDGRYPAFEAVFTIEKLRGAWKFGLNSSIPVPLRPFVQSVGFIIEGDNAAYRFTNGTLNLKKTEIDFRPMKEEGWNFVFVNRTSIEARKQSQFTSGQVYFDPFVQIDSSIDGSDSGHIGGDGLGGFQIKRESAISLGADYVNLPPVGEPCYAATLPECAGFITFNVSSIPRSAQVNLVNLSIKLAHNGFLNLTDSILNLYSFTRASPFYNNASYEYEHGNISNTLNYTNLSTTKGIITGGGYNITLSSSVNDPASKDLMFSLSRLDAFRNNFTIGILFNYNQSPASSFNNYIPQIHSSRTGANAPRLFVNYTINAPRIYFVDPTPANGTLQQINWSYTNVTVEADTNASAWIDFNRSLVAWYAMDYHNASGIYDNSTYKNFVIFSQVNVSESNVTTGIRGDGITFNGFRGQRLTVNHSESLRLNHSNLNFTIMLWINKRGLTLSPPQSNFMSPIGKQNVSSPQRGWGINTQNDNLRVQFFNVNTTSVDFSTPTNSINNGSWWHVALVGNSTHFAVFINGNIRATVRAIQWTESETQLTIGGRNLVNTIANDNPFNGSVDEVLIFNRTLSNLEINASFESGMYRLERNFTNLPDGNYTYQAHTIDAIGLYNTTENRTLEIGPAPPSTVTVTLISPPDASNFSNINRMNFTASAITSAGTLKNATLYGNFTSAFIANETNTTSLANGSIYQFFNIPINFSLYSWTVQVCNTFDSCGVASVNWTFSSHPQAPTIVLQFPPNGQTLDNGSVNFTATATTINATIKNATLWINSNGTFLPNSTITTTGDSFFYLNLSNGQYTWNVYYCDTGTPALCAFAPADFIVIILFVPEVASSNDALTTYAALIFLGMLFLIWGFWENKFVYKVIGGTLFLIAGINLLSLGYSFVQPIQYATNSTTCFEAKQLNSTNAFNFTTGSLNCTLANSQANYQLVSKTGEIDKAPGMLFLLLGIAAFLEALWAWFRDRRAN